MSIYDQYVAPQPTPPQAAEIQPNVVRSQPVMNSAQANQVLNQYGIDPSQTLSATNITNTLTRPTAAPDDLLGIRGQIEYDLGLPQARTDYQNALAASMKRVTDLNKVSALMEGQRINLGAIRGEQAQERSLAAPEIQAFQDQAKLLGEKLNSLTSERDYRTGVAEKNIDFTRNLKLQYPGAKIGFGDSLDTIETKLVSYEKEKKKEAEKDALKNACRQLGLKTNGSTSDLEKRLRKYNKEAAKEAKANADLEREKIRLDIENTRSLISQRNQANTTFDPNSIAKLFETDTQSIQPPKNSSYWDYLK